MQLIPPEEAEDLPFTPTISIVTELVKLIYANEWAE